MVQVGLGMTTNVYYSKAIMYYLWDIVKQKPSCFKAAWRQNFIIGKWVLWQDMYRSWGVFYSTWYNLSQGRNVNPSMMTHFFIIPFSSTCKRMHKVISAHLQGLKIHLFHLRGKIKGFMKWITNYFDRGFLAFNEFLGTLAILEGVCFAADASCIRNCLSSSDIEFSERF